LDQRSLCVGNFKGDEDFSAAWVGFREAAALEFSKDASLRVQDFDGQTVHFSLSYGHGSLLVAIASITNVGETSIGGPMYKLENVFIQRLWRGEKIILCKLVSHLQFYVQKQTRAIGYLIDSGDNEPWFPRLIESCILDPEKGCWYWIAPA
jgi:hypothetical protein